MERLKKNYAIWLLLYLILISYLVINTGIFSDDFDVINILKERAPKDIFVLKGNSYFIDTPLQYLSHYVWYRFFQIDSLYLLNILKILYIFLCFYLISQFFKIYLGKHAAFLASFLFIFYPSHDSSVYFFMSQYLTLSFGFYLYAFYLAHHNKLFLSFLFALIASFISYGSTPIAIALFVLFVLNKKFKKGAVILIPNIIYFLYFIPVNIFSAIGHPRIIESISVFTVIRQFMLQLLTFIDSIFGPSMWLKIYYSFPQLSLISIIIGLIFTMLFLKISRASKERYDLRLIISLIVLMVSSFLMYAFTGRYPQLAFNLGNRTTIYGSLLLVYLIVLMPASIRIKGLIFVLMIFSILGISDHWKNWNVHQQRIIANIKDNQYLNKYEDGRVIYVSGSQYSKYGPISHIEFFSEDWVVGPVFNLALNKDIPARCLNKRHKYTDGYLIDTKYNLKTEAADYINVYDSERDILFKLDTKDINNYISSLPPDNRHWVQILDFQLPKDIAVKLMPRLKYAL